MKRNIIIGIVSSLILIINYLEVGFVDLFFPNIEWLIKMNETVFRLIFSIGMIGFYYSLSKYFKIYQKKSEINILNSLIILVFVSFILNGIQHFYGIIPGFILTILYLTGVILFIVFGVKVLQIKDVQFLNIKNLKIFIISMFIAFGLVLIFIVILTLNMKVELINIVFSIYTLPYIFGLIFFINIYNNQQLTQK